MESAFRGLRQLNYRGLLSAPQGCHDFAIVLRGAFTRYPTDRLRSILCAKMPV